VTLMTRLFIVDTNVLIAGLLTRRPDSPTVRLLDAMLDGSLMFLLSPELLAEYRAVLLRPRIASIHGLSESDVDALLTEITANAIWREPQPQPTPAPDSGDAHLWALLACEANAALITGDELLLRNPLKGRLVIRPGDFFTPRLEIVAIEVDGRPVIADAGGLEVGAGQTLRIAVTLRPRPADARFRVMSDGITWGPATPDSVLPVSTAQTGLRPVRIAAFSTGGAWPADTTGLLVRVSERPVARAEAPAATAAPARPGDGGVSPVLAAILAAVLSVVAAGAVVWFYARRRAAAGSAGVSPVPRPPKGATVVGDGTRALSSAGGFGPRPGEGDSLVDRLKSELEIEVERLRARVSELLDTTKRLRKMNRELREEVCFLEESNAHLRELQQKKEELLAMIAHDIKNPAGAIAALAELLQSYDGKVIEQKGLIDEILMTSARILRLSQDLSDALVAEVKDLPLDLKVDSLRPMVESVVRMNQAAAARKQIAIRASIPDTLPQIEMDGPRIEEVLDNLVCNAVKYSRPESTVRVDLKGTPSHITIEVIDTGPGFSSQDMEQAFQLGQKLTATPTGGEESSGLGLWIVRKIVEAHHGLVYIRSTPGKGSVFTVKLPTLQGN